MPDLIQPNFPVTEKPHLSPNPKLVNEIKDGGRGTPEIVMTEPKVQAPYDPREAVEALQAEISALDTEIDGVADDLATEKGKITTLQGKVTDLEKGVSYLTTAPTADNTNGHLIFVVLEEEPDDYYDGYLYFVAPTGE